MTILKERSKEILAVAEEGTIEEDSFQVVPVVVSRVMGVDNDSLQKDCAITVVGKVI